MVAVSQRQTNTCLPIFCYLRAERATTQRRPLLQLKTNRLVLPARHWKCPLQLITCGGNVNRGVFTKANKYSFADLLLFESGEGDEATSPSFATENESIHASSSSLEAPIATYYMWGGCERGRFHNGKQIPVC